MSSKRVNREEEAKQLFEESYRHEEAGNYDRAFQCLLAAAKLGDSGAQVNLGNYYANGTSVAKNFGYAEIWYKRAYRAGDRTGANNLAIDRRNAGRTRSAIFWFRKAIMLGDGDASIPLAKMYIAKKNRTSDAIFILETALTMNTDRLSEAGREEASALLEEIARKKGIRQ